VENLPQWATSYEQVSDTRSTAATKKTPTGAEAPASENAKNQHHENKACYAGVMGGVALRHCPRDTQYFTSPRSKASIPAYP